MNKDYELTLWLQYLDGREYTETITKSKLVPDDVKLHQLYESAMRASNFVTKMKCWRPDGKPITKGMWKLTENKL